MSNNGNTQKNKGIERFGDASFSKGERLCLFTEFQRVKSRGKKFNGRYMTLLVAESETGSLKVGFICSRKFSKKAVERNKAKRILKEIFRNSKAILEKCEILLIPRRAILEEKNVRLIQEEFLNLMHEANKCPKVLKS